MRTTIPTSFVLANRKWTVEVVDLIDNDPDVLGTCSLDEALITLKARADRSLLEDTFFHEFIHAVRGTLGHKDNKKNHAEVDAIGSMFHQFLQTKKGRLL